MIFQYIVVCVILIIILIIFIKRTYNTFNNPCVGCYGCQLNDLKKQLKKKKTMKNFILKEEKITSNKSYCLQVLFSKISYFGLKGSFKLFTDDYYFKFGLSIFGDIFTLVTYWNRRMDHAGFTFELTVLGASLYFKIYDNRHWDYEENNWKNTYIE